MVYESDFYTTRRPYSSRPLVSTYSVTTPTYRVISIPTVSRVTTRTYSTYPIYSSYPTVFHRSIPYAAHKRLVTGTRITTTPTRIISTRVFRSPTRVIRSVTPTRVYRSYTPARVITSPIRVINIRTRPSVLSRELKRIESRALTHPHYYATESYLNSWGARAFDDETRDIRNATNVLLRKVHTRVERAHSVSPVSYSSKYETKHGPDTFVSRLLSPLKSTIYDGINSYNPNQYIVGNKAYNTRRATTHFDDDKVRNDVNLLSYYLKNRKAAAEKREAPIVLESAKKPIAESNDAPVITEVE